MRIFSSCSILLLFSVLFAANLAAQPQVSYIIPDIGAPGMNTYVEIIAPQGVTGTFGPDGIYLNNPGEDLRVFATGGAASDIIVGPLVVSWNGRLISTHVYVKPGVGVNRTVQLVVERGGNQSTPLDFEIVNPIPLSSGAGGVLGQGSLGQRSKRGAMIVSSISLTAGNYTISTNEVDNGTPGNQGYLPFILISRGPVTIASGVTITANANGRDGGPGGGGGGGQMCDRTFLGNGGNGGDGGNGYTGGGAGGQNYSGGASSFRNTGAGTGSNGNSLNNASSGNNSVCYEGTGGGTGHPFGRGGVGWCGSETPDGQYGGGSTSGQNSGGGGAGFTADGSNASGTNAGNSRGRINGNAELVPFAGGSGGAGGNPQELTGGCGGTGGGGGGAIAIYSMGRMAMGTVRAVGGNGADGSRTSDGGGGSGGAIVLGTKLDGTPGNTHDVARGNGSGSGGNGSVGRGRYDGFIANLPTFTSGASSYVGPSTDTTSYSTTSNFTLTGTRGGTSNIRVYMRGDNTNWQLLSAPTYTGRNWNLNVVTPGGGNYYFAAFQEVLGPGNGQYTAQPSWVTSQVAGNVVRVVAVPRIDTVGSPLISLGITSGCPGDSLTQPVLRFKSTGNEDLRVFIELGGVDRSQFEVVAPPGISTLPGLIFPPGPDEIVVQIRFKPTTPGQKNAFIRLITNDPRKGFDTLGPINFSAIHPRVEVSLSRDTLDLGQVCLNTAVMDSIWVRYIGEKSFSIASVLGLKPNSPFSLVRPTAFPAQFKQPLPSETVEDSIPIVVRFRPRTAGPFTDSLVIKDDCGEHILYLRGEGFEAKLVAPAAVNFGQVAITTTSDQTIVIRNTGGNPVTIRTGDIVPANSGYTIIDPPNIDGQVINANDSLVITVRFAPDTIGPYNARLEFEIEGPCSTISPINLNGFGVDVCLQANPMEFSFVADSCSVSPEPLDTVVTLENCGGIDVEILETFSVNNKVALTFPVTLPRTLGTISSTNIRGTITWDPVNAGTGTDSVAVIWRDTKRGTLDTLWIPITLTFDRAIVQLQTVSGDTVPSLLDIGGVYQCSPARDTVVLVNAGTVEGEITGGFETGGMFEVDPPLPFHLDVGESKILVISLDPSKTTAVGTSYQDQLVLRNGKCDQEWKIGVVSTRYDLTFDVDDVNFGGTNLGLPRTQTVQFVNTTNAPPIEELVIGSVYIDPPSASPPFAIVDPTLLPVRVQADSGRFDLPVSFTPSAEQVYTGQLCFHIVEPCDTIICVDMEGEGIRSNIYVPDGDLNFGDVYFCDDSTMMLTIYSVGPQPLRVDSIRIIGPDQAGFEILSVSKPRPTTLLPGFPTIQDSINVRIRFNPAAVPPDGPKSATLEIYSNDSAQGLLAIPLIGNRVSPTIVGPAVVNYGTVVVNATATQGVTLTNTSRDTIRILNPRVNAPFRILSSLPLVIPPGETITVNVEFKPGDSRVYNDTLIGLFTDPCNGEVRVPLTGEGLRGNTVISIPTILTGEPRQRISIPIVLEEAESIAQVGATTFRAWIRFDASMLLPVDVQFNGAAGKPAAASGSIISKIIDGTDRVVEVEIKNDPLPAAPDTLGWIDAVVLLGNSLTTPVTFDSLRWIDGEVATTTKDGEFTLNGYCDVGSNRLVRVEGAFGIKAVTPNPLESAAEIQFETVENGRTTLEVYDLYGRRVTTLLNVDDLPVQAHIVQWSAGDEAAGVYYAVLTTPTQRSVQRMVLVK